MSDTRPTGQVGAIPSGWWSNVTLLPPAEYWKPGVVWKIKRYLYGDKRSPRGWQDDFEKTMLDLGFERLEFRTRLLREEGSF